MRTRRRGSIWDFSECVQKLKNDQRSATADIAVLISHVPPREMGNFGERDGVWVTDYPSFIGLAAALREQLVSVAQVKRASIGKDQKMEVLYSYLTGAEFRQRVQAIIETFAALQEDLAQELLAVAQGADQVSDVWVAGRHQLDNGRLIGIDIDSLFGRTSEWRARIEAIRMQ